MEKRLNEIIARKAEISKELGDATAEKLAELNTETNTLLVEERELRNKMDLAGKLVSDKVEPKNEERSKSDLEKRGAMLREKRSITIGSGSLIKPMGNQTEINPNHNEVSSIVDLVKVTDCMNMSEYQVPYQKSSATAGKTTEGGNPNASDPVFDYAVIKPVKITTYSEVSRETNKLTDVAYYNAVLNSAKVALRKKVSEYIVNSDATTNATFIGVKDADALVSNSDLEITTIDAKTLRTIAMNYGGDENIIGNAVLFLSKKDLIAFGDVRGTNEKKAVYDIIPDTTNPNTGLIKDGGLTVRYCINSNLAVTATATAGDFTMIYGIPTCYELGLFSDYSVRVSEDYAFKTGMIAVLGEVMIGGNVTIYDGFVRVKKATA